MQRCLRGPNLRRSLPTSTERCSNRKRLPSRIARAIGAAEGTRHVKNTRLYSSQNIIAKWYLLSPKLFCLSKNTIAKWYLLLPMLFCLSQNNIAKWSLLIPRCILLAPSALASTQIWEALEPYMAHLDWKFGSNWGPIWLVWEALEPDMANLEWKFGSN